MAQTMLKVDNINVYYGNIHAVKNVSFEVNEGEIVTLIGANGAGNHHPEDHLRPAAPPKRVMCCTRARASRASARTRSWSRAWPMCRKAAMCSCT